MCYGQWPGCDALAELAKAPVEEPVPELNEQLDWAPPELDDEAASPPLMDTKRSVLAALLGPRFEALVIAKEIELVEALELVEQLPELPLTPDGEFVCCVLEELLQLYAFAIGANVGLESWPKYQPLK